MTQKRGLVIHRRDCPSLKNSFPERLKTVAWNEDQEHVYPVRYELLVQNKPGLLSTVSNITAQADSNITKLETESISHTMGKLRVTFEVKDVQQLKKIIQKFLKTKGIYQVIRKRISEK